MILFALNGLQNNFIWYYSVNDRSNNTPPILNMYVSKVKEIKLIERKIAVIRGKCNIHSRKWKTFKF